MLRRLSRTMATVAALSALVLVSQAGAADKLVVKDAGGTNTIFRVDDTGSTLVGTGTPNAFSWIKLYIAANGDTGFGVENFTDSSVNSAPGALFRRARGTQTAPLAVQNGATPDRLGFFLFGGYDGAAFVNTAGITARVDGPVSSGVIPTRFGFETGVSTATRVERFTIGSTGNIGIGETKPTQKLEIKDGGIRLNNATATKPACDATSRGTIWFAQGASTDVAEICALVSGTYGWRQLF